MTSTEELTVNIVAPILVVVLLVILLKKRSKKNLRATRMTGYDGHRVDATDCGRARRKMLALDPSFKPDVFLDRIRNAFLQIQEAWQRQRMLPVQHFISDGILERFSLQLAEQRDMGYRDHMEQIRIRQCDFAETTTTQLFDSVTVQITASAVDYRVSLVNNTYLSGSHSPETFTEFWTFVRRRGVETQADANGLIEGYCPNCGDAIQLNQVGACASCDALLRSGEFDWVLTEITQACEWRTRGNQELENAESYRQDHDEGFTIQHLEDRASVIFWRQAMADRLGNVKPLMKMARDRFCKLRQSRIDQGWTDGARRYIGNCSVGSVDLRRMVRDKSNDYALIEIRWSGNKHVVDRQGRVRDLGGWKRYRTLFVLMRKRGVKTNVERSVSSAHCIACGAPESDIASDACEYCEEVLNSGEHDWVLCSCHPAGSQRAQKWLSRMNVASPRKASPDAVSRGLSAASQRVRTTSHADAITWMIGVFAEDKKIDNREREILQQLAKSERLSTSSIRSVISDALKGELEVEIPRNIPAKRVWMGTLADVALLDGEIDAAERQMLLELSDRIHMPRAEANLVINKRRAHWARVALNPSQGELDNGVS